MVAGGVLICIVICFNAVQGHVNCILEMKACTSFVGDKSFSIRRSVYVCYILLVFIIYFVNSLCGASDYYPQNTLERNGHWMTPQDEKIGEHILQDEISFPCEPSTNHPSVIQKRSSEDTRINSTNDIRSGADDEKQMAIATALTVSVDPSNVVPPTTPKPAANTTNITSTTTSPGDPVLPDKGSAEDEHNSSMSIFFVLCVLALGILLIHLMLQKNFQYLPESIAIVFLGGLIGLVLNLMSNQNIANWRKEEAFSPTAFFLVLLPPIIFESGYNLHKGNFFQNIGSILVFAILGTTISALVIGAGVYVLGLAKVAYQLSFVESFAFGSLISAVDPVATVAIFHAMNVDPVLNMLVFGESILNDAVAIVLTTSILESSSPVMTSSETFITGFNRFCLMFFASAGIGVVFALASALLLKHVDLRKNPSLEFGIMLVFTYAPYALAEGIHLSGKLQLHECHHVFFFILHALN